MTTETLQDKESKLWKDILTESTGKSICDSGGIFGREWQRNQENPPWEKPEILYHAHRFNDNSTELIFSVNMYHWLMRAFEVDFHLTEAMYKYDRLTGGVKSWLELASDFAELIAENRGYREVIPFNSYNEDCWLQSQVFQAELLRSPGENELWIVSIHQGADVRGGYARPVVVRPVEENLIPYVTLEIGDKSFDFDGHEWYDVKEGYYADYKEDMQPLLDECELIDGKLYYDGDEIGLYALFS